MTYHDAPFRGSFHDWYETWRAGHTDRREAAERERRGHERDDRRIAALLIAHTVAGGAPASLAVTLVMAH